MSKVSYYKGVNNSMEAKVTKILTSGLGKNILMTFGETPTIEEIETGTTFRNLYEITKEEYDKLHQLWLSSYCWKVYRNDEPKEEELDFKPLTRYTLVHGNLVIVGYSSKTKVELSKFLQDHRGLDFTMVDENGSLVALIGEEISQEATYTFESL